MYLAILISLFACGVNEIAELEDSLLRQDIQAYIAECLYPDAEILSFEKTQV